MSMFYFLANSWGKWICLTLALFEWLIYFRSDLQTFTSTVGNLSNLRSGNWKVYGDSMSLRRTKRNFLLKMLSEFLELKCLSWVWVDKIVFKLNASYHSYLTWVSHCLGMLQPAGTGTRKSASGSPWPPVHILTFCSSFLHLWQGNQLIESIFSHPVLNLENEKWDT